MEEQQIVSTRGKQKFAYNGYLYVFDKNSKKEPDVKFRRCKKNSAKPVFILSGMKS